MADNGSVESSDVERQKLQTSAQSNATYVLDPFTASHTGVKKIEAAEKVYGKYSKWILFCSLGLAFFVYSLDSITTSSYLTFAVSVFSAHGVISSIQTAQLVLAAVGKPIIAKMSDVTSRATACAVVVVIYVIGYITVASAQNIGAIAAGINIHIIGLTGAQILSQILIADSTNLRWRGLAFAGLTMPYVITAFVGSNISAAVLEGVGWRWGYGMFTILVPAAVSPLFATVFWAERKAKRLGIVQSQQNPPEVAAKPPTRRRLFKLRRLASQMDLIGLVLLTAAISLILLPLTLSRTVSNGWKNGSIIAMLVVGVVFLFAFGWWDAKYASHPVIPSRFLKNRTVVLCGLIGFFDFMSYYLTIMYLFVFVVVVKPWSLVNVNYFMQAQSVGLTVFALLGGVLMLTLRRYKIVAVVGLMIRTLGVGLMIHSRGANGSTVELVFTQILQGLGGGLASVSGSVGSQASVVHADLATVTAAVLLLTEIGGAIGVAIAGAIWTSTMPDNIAKYLPFLSEKERDLLYNNIPFVLAYERGHPVREGIITAYGDTMHIIIIVALVLSIIPMLLSFFLPNWYLSDKRNAVEEEDERQPKGH